MLVEHQILVGVFLCVFIRKSLRTRLQDVMSMSSSFPLFPPLLLFPPLPSLIATTAATGLLGMMGNKGGAAIRFKLMDSSICFVCSHLAAHRENVAGRNADFHKYFLYNSLMFKDLRSHSFQEGRGRRGRFWHYEP